MPIAYLDTNAAIRLYDGKVRKLSRLAVREIERCDLLISPMVYLEFEYLRTTKGFGHGPDRIFSHLTAKFDIQLCTMPLAAIGVLAAQLGWTTDPFDRIIVANAWANQEAPLITSDEKIRAHYKQAVW